MFWSGCRHAELAEQVPVGGVEHHVEPGQEGGGGAGLDGSPGAVALAVEQPGQVEVQPGLEVGQLGTGQLVEALLQSRDGAGAVSLCAAHAGPQPGRRAGEGGQAESVGAGVELRRRFGGPGHVALGELGLDQYPQQRRGPDAVVAHHPQTPAGGGPRQLVVATGQIEPGGGNQRLEMIVVSEQQAFRLREPALEDAQLGQGGDRVPAGAGHDLLDGVVGPKQHVLGLSPSPEVAEHGALQAAAVAARVRLGAGGGAEDAPLAQQRAPRLHPLEVGRDVAGGEEGAHRLADDDGILGAAAAGQGHRLVDPGHALGHPPRLDVGQPTVGQGLDLEVDVAEAPGPVERQLGPFAEHGRVADVAAQRRQRHPPLFDARLFVLHQAYGAPEPRLCGRPVAHEVGEQVTDPCAGHGGPAVVAGDRERPCRGGEVRNGAVVVTGAHGRVRQLQQVPRPNAVLRQRHTRIVQLARSFGRPEGRGRRPRGQTIGCTSDEAHEDVTPEREDEGWFDADGTASVRLGASRGDP